MSKQFKAIKLLCLLEPAVVQGHNKTPYVNPDFSFGQMFAIDSNGDWFYFCRSTPKSYQQQQKAWPYDRATNSVPLFRDYWKHCLMTEGAPYFDSLIQGKWETVIDCSN